MGETVAGNTKNLKPFKPGADWTGNAGGRPKKRPITDFYFETSEKPLPEKLRLKINAKCGEEVLKKGCTWAEANSVRRFLDSVSENDGHRHSKEIRESMEGKAPQRIEVAQAARTEITIRMIHDRPARPKDS